MWKTSNSLQGSPAALIVVQQQADGTYKATAPNQPLKAQTGATEIEAIGAMKRALQDAFMSGNVEGR